MKPRVLILSASVGGGHLRAAEAVEVAFRSHVTEADAENHDVLEFTNAVFRRVYAQSYLDLVQRAPHLLGYLYDWLDQPSRTRRQYGDRLRQAMEKLNLKRFEKFLSRDHWDVVINTHFLPAELIASLRKEGRLDIPQLTVCTDFETHRLWVNPRCEHYFCATEEGATYLQHWGVPEQQVEVTGIPIHPAFSEPVDQSACRRQLGLDAKRPVILQMCGGFGVGPVEEITCRLLDVQEPIQLVVFCGRNQELNKRVAALVCPDRHRLVALGFTTEMHQWMGSANLLVSKPGGLTTSEALASGLPMLIINPIPGQESRNSDYLLENGAAIKANHPALLPLKLSRLLRQPDQLAQMRLAASRLGHPHAALNVARRSLRFVG